MSEPAKTADKGPKAQPLALPTPWLRFLERLRATWTSLPLVAKLGLSALLVTALISVTFFASEPVWREQAVLFSQLEPEDAASIVEKLEAQQVPYELTDATTITVPAEQVHALRLQMAAEGLPRGGQVGFESFENMRLGATEFEQHVTYRRAMEGELARTISTVKTVEGARVHLVLPQKSVFAQKREPAEASVVVRLSGDLEPSEVSGIVHLVAAAVPDLETDRIALVTTDGRMLHRPRPTDEDGELPVDGDHLSASHQLERQLEDRTQSMLERVLGPGHVDVRVRAELDTAKVERTHDSYDPSRTALRSEQAMEERLAAGDADTIAGVPGAMANLPETDDEGLLGEEIDYAQAQAEANQTGVLRKSHTRNFEIERVQERRVSISQRVDRLAVAVVVDGVETEVDGQMKVVPRDAAEIDKLSALVKSAVGFDAERGDTVTIESVPFFVPEMPPETPEARLVPLPDQVQSQVDKWLPLAKIAGLSLVALVALLWIRRRIKKLVAKHEEARAKLLEAEAEKAALPAASDSESDEAVVPEPLQIDYRVEAIERAQRDPATAALVLRHWLEAEVEAAGDESVALSPTQ